MKRLVTLLFTVSVFQFVFASEEEMLPKADSADSEKLSSSLTTERPPVEFVKVIHEHYHNGIIAIITEEYVPKSDTDRLSKLESQIKNEEKK